MKIRTSLIAAVSVLALTHPLISGSKLDSPKVPSSEFTAKLSPNEHYNLAMQDMEQNNWRSALRNFTIVSVNFPDAEMAEDAFYFQAVCQYNLMNYDIANQNFTEYLNQKMRLQYFEDALDYKLAIADKFKLGAKKHLFQSEKMPKWGSAKEDALAIYDELITIVPNHEIAAKALLGKANLLQKLGDSKPSIETYETLIKRFPQNPLASDAYLAIAEIYYAQSHTEFQNPDLLELARLNLKRYISSFPRDPKVEDAKRYLADIEEIHAKSLYDTGLFYERTKKPKASVIYYVTAIEKFPNTHASTLCKKRLNRLSDEVAELQVSPELIL